LIDDEAIIELAKVTSTEIPVKSIAIILIKPPNFHNYRALILRVRHVSTIGGPLKAIYRLF